MKRKNKCVASKKAYSTRSECLKIINKFLKQGRRLRYYECPVCLDFHLTSKGTKSQFSQIKSELKLLKQAKKKISQDYHKQQTIRKESRLIIEKQWREFRRLYNKYCTDNQINHKKLPTILKGVLPREERLRILAQMKEKQQKTTLWKTKMSTLLSWYNRC